MKITKFILFLFALMILFQFMRDSHEKFTAGYDEGTRKIILYYAPWCGYCKDLWPTWKNVRDSVKRSKDGDKIVFEEIDADKNKVAEINGFPTIVMIEGGKKRTYNGSREFQPLFNWAIAPTPSAYV